MSIITRNESKIFAKGVIGNVRKAQEDNHGYKLGTPNGDLFVVCDGMGGHVGGAKASEIAVNCIIDRISSQKYATPIDALNDALQFANMQILGYADAHPEFKGMGTTACIVLLQDDGAWIAHVGDSRIYLYLGQEKQLHRITKDHSYVQTLVDSGEITDEQAEHHPNKNRILKALGIKPELKPTFNFENRPIHPKDGDIFLICSDGLCGMIPDATICRVLGTPDSSLSERGEKLISSAMIGETVQPGGQDNCTLELIEVDNSLWHVSEFKSYNPAGHVPVAEAPKPNINIENQSIPTPKTQPIKWWRRKTIVVAISISLAIVALAIIGLIRDVYVLQRQVFAEKAVSQITEDETKNDNFLKEAKITLDNAKKDQAKCPQNDEHKKNVDENQRNIDTCVKKAEKIDGELSKAKKELEKWNSKKTIFLKSKQQSKKK